MDDQSVAISLKRFLLIEQCPAAWKNMDLYIFRDDAVTFYVGQSRLAFARVWEHLLGGFKGHSMVGRFVWTNWPGSMKFTVELLNSKLEQFNGVGNNLSEAERLLIQQHTPCFNISHNIQRTPIPEKYFPANGSLRCPRSLNKIIYEAERAVKAEERQVWLRELEC
jgi:hypothetical protein